MPGVARVLGKTGLAVGLGLVLVGPTVQAAEAILPPAKAAAGHHAVPAKPPKSKASRSKAKHRHHRAAAHQSQLGADLKPGTSSPPIVTHPAKKSPAKAHPNNPKKKPGKAPVTAPTPKPPARSRTNPVISHRRRPSLAGTWSLFGGEFKFTRIGVRTISDSVISQRIGVFCPAVNDQDGQLVVRQTDKHHYIGTWQWFNPKTCKSAGYGTVRIWVWRNKLTAVFTAYPPPGQPGPPDTTKMERLP
jgi:hypothetical protein